LHLSPANQSGTGSTNVIFSYDANSGATRSGTLTIAGQALTVTQAGSTYVAAGVLINLVSGLSEPSGVGVDGAGNVDFADFGDGTVKRWTPTSATVTPLLDGMEQPRGLAVDGAGNVYVTDTDASTIVEWIAASNSVFTLPFPGVDTPFGVAADAAGNIFDVNLFGGSILGWTPTNDTVFSSISVGGELVGLACDAADNLYCAVLPNVIVECNPNSTNVTTLVSSGLGEPFGVAVDGSGNVYIADYGASTIRKWIAADRILTTLVSSGLSSPIGVAVDAAGNMYVGDSGNNSVQELPNAFLDTTPKSYPSEAAKDVLPVVLTTANLLTPPFAPTSDQPWLKITGVTNDIVSFSITTNYGPARTGYITLLGRPISVTQQHGSSYLSTTALLEGPLSGTDSVVLTVTPSTLSWTATGNVTWLHLGVANQSGTGSATVVFTFDANTGATRAGTLTIAGLILDVTQAGPIYSFGTTALLEGPAEGSDGVVLGIIPTNANWAATVNATWLHLSAANQNGAGSTNVIFMFDANPGLTRSGSISIGGQTLTVTQAGSTYVPVTNLTWVSSVGPGPNGVAVDSAGNGYAGTYYAGTLYFYGAIYEIEASTYTTFVIFNEELQGIRRLAVDESGNFYFDSFVSYGLLEWTPSNNVVTTLVSSELSYPYGVAVDSAGNVYIADGGDNAVKEWVAANGSLITLVSTGLDSPEGVAVDAAGNVYIANTGSNSIQELLAGNNTMITLDSSNLNNPQSISVDGSGNVYFADTGNNAIKVWSPANHAVSTLLSGLTRPSDVAVSVSGNAYVVENSGNGFAGYGDVLMLTRCFVDPTLRLESLAAGSDSLPPVLPMTQVLQGSFAPLSHQPWLTITGVTNGVVSFSFSASTTNRTGYLTVLGQTIPVAQGAESFSYSLGTTSLLEGPTLGTDSVVLGVSTYFGPWTASANALWLHLNQSGLGSTNVIFDYDANPGETRFGTLSIAGQTVTVTQAGSTYVQAGALTTLVSNGLSYPAGVAVDGAGNVYVADYSDSAIYKWNKADNVVTSLVSSGLDNPQGVAVDGAGNVYIADTGNNAIKEWTVANSNVTTLVSSGLSYPVNLAVDGGDNIYIADTDDDAIKVWTAANSNLTTLVSLSGTSPEGVAVDGAGNVYYSSDYDLSPFAVWKWNVDTGEASVLSASVGLPLGVAVDGSGNVYVADFDDKAIVKWAAANSTLTNWISSGLSNETGVAVDSTGNIYVADERDNAIKELPRTFVDPTPKMEGAGAGLDLLPVVLPSTENLIGPFMPTSDATWLTVVGITNGVVSYSFTAASSNRTANLTVLGQSISITQSTVTFVFSTNSLFEGSTAGSDSVFLLVNPNTAVWTATADVPWLHVSLANQSGVGSTNLAFSFDANPGAVRSGAIIVAGQALTVIQSASVVLLGLNSLWEGPSAGSDSVVLAVTPANAEWMAAPNAAWLHVSLANHGGAGSTNVVFSYDANPGSTRTGTLSFAGRTLTITQAGSSYVLAGIVTAVVSSGLNAPHGVAANGQGGVCIADTFNNVIKMWTPTSDSVGTLVVTGLNSPSGVAFDSAGNIYFTDSGNNAIKMWTAANSNVTALVSTGLNTPEGVAVDRAGNVYVADTGNSAIKEWTLTNAAVTVLVSSGLSYPGGVAVDAAGNVYIADTGNNAIKEWIAANSNVTTLAFSGLSTPEDVAVDGAGNVYAADTGNGMIKKWTMSGNTVTALVSSGLSYPYGVGVDGAGNLYIADTDNQAIKELPRAFVDPTPKTESLAAGTDVLPVVLPATTDLLPPFAPVSGQPWLTIGGIANGAVSFDFTANNGLARTANITLLGQTIPIMQRTIGTSMAVGSVQLLGNGIVEFTFTSIPSASFTILATTNLSLPLSEWVAVGPPTESPPGQYQFTDAQATNSERFYVVRSP
jgi:DNA-binding beta-propeller fold protein YncE